MPSSSFHRWKSSALIFDRPMCPIFPSSFESQERADLVFDGHLPVDAMQVAELQPLYPQPVQAPLDGGAEARGCPKVVTA